MPYATLAPKPGAEHHSQSPGGAWTFPYGGAWIPIKNPDGTPRSFPMPVAYTAMEYFTPKGGPAPGDTLVELDVHEGELILAPAVQHVTCPECQERLPLGEIAEHLRDHYAPRSARPSDVDLGELPPHVPPAAPPPRRLTKGMI